MLLQRLPKSAIQFSPRSLRRKCYRSLGIIRRIRLRSKGEETFSWNLPESEGDSQETFVECVEGFRTRINDEFAGMAQLFRATAGPLSDGMTTYTKALLSILEDKSASAISRQEAGYCIKRLMSFS